MARLELCIRRLSGFTDNAEKLVNEKPVSRRRIKFAGSLNAIQKNVKKLHEALGDCWCNLHAPRRAGLVLNPRIARAKKQIRPHGNVPVPLPDCFTICLDERLPGRKWVTAEFKIPEILLPYVSQLSPRLS
jgi:hypothetical protein